MRNFLLIALVCVLSVAAGPLAQPDKDAEERFIVSNIVENAIKDIQDQIRDAGLDPLNVESFDASFSLPIPVLFNIRGWLRNLVCTGISNIVTNTVDHSVLLSRVRVGVSLPEIYFALGDAGVDATILGNNLSGFGGGSVRILSPKIDVELRYNIGIISGFTITRLSIDFSLQGIQSDVNVVIQGNDISDSLNYLLSVKIPADIASHRNEINSVLENLVWDIIG